MEPSTTTESPLAAPTNGVLPDPPTLPDHPTLFRQLDPAATLAFRTPLQEHPPAADTKAAAILTGFGLMFTILAKFGDRFSKELFEPGNERWFMVLLLLAFTGLSLGAILEAFRTLIPRFPVAPPSLAFFGDIAKLSLEQYVERVSKISHEDALEEMLHYNHTLSLIIVEKFKHLRAGIKYIRAAFACWMLLIFLINIGIMF